MEHNNLIDTTLSDNDNKLISNATTIKRHIYSFIDNNKVLNFLINLIDKSEYIKFERETDKRFLNLLQLQMYLTLELDNKSSLLQKKNNNDKSTTIDKRTEYISNTVIVPFIDLLSELFQKITFDKEPVKYADVVYDLIGDSAKDLRNKINSIIELSEEDKEELHRDFNFAFGLINALTFPPDDVDDIDNDKGFTLEIML